MTSPEASQPKTPVPAPAPELDPDDPSLSDPVLRKFLRKQQARIRQLQQEIVSRQEDNETVILQNIKQTEELHKWMNTLDQKVIERTRSLELSQKTLAEQNTKLQELVETKEALTHMIVHDMKNPLTAILGTLCLFRNKRFATDPAGMEFITSAHLQTVKLICMVEEILTISRMQSKEFTIQPAPANLIELVRQSLSLMNQLTAGKKLQFRFQTGLQELWVAIDFQMVERIINNLLNNAIKYAPDPSEIVVEVNEREGQAWVSVTNWGDPIPEQFHKRLFDLFFRVNAQDKVHSGTGLGLAFCKLAVEAHHGSIYVESPVSPDPTGARFHFSLPLTEKPAASGETA